MKIIRADKSKRGFSLTEIILVFAIGSTVTVGVFLSIGAFKRNARDRERMADRDTIAVAFKAYASAHDGTLPTMGDQGSGNTIERTVGPGQQNIIPTSPLIANGYLSAGDVIQDPLARNEYKIRYDEPNCTSDVVSESAPAILYYNRINDREFNLGICLETKELNIQNYGS